MPQDILDLLARIDELSDEEISGLYDSLIAGFDEADEAGNVDLMDEFHNAINTVRETQTTRDQQAEANAQRAAELRNSVHAGSDEAEDADAETDDETDEADEDEDADTATDAPQAVAASTRAATPAPARPSLGTATASTRRTAASRRPQPTESTSRAQVFAQRSIGAVQTGDVIGDATTLADLMTETIRRLGRGDGEQRLVASARWEYPEDRMLGTDIAENERKIDAVTNPRVLVASGGICNPVDVDFSIPMIVSTDEEPLGDSLPTFGATRGGVRFMQPPTFSQVGGAGTTVWTEIQDANPGTATKPIQKINCGNEVEVFVDAIPTRLQFGNMSGRFYPEMVAANTTLALANAARIRELNRVSKIAAASTTVSSGQLLGAARDFLATLDQAAAAYRYRSRIKRGTVQLRAVLPEWMRDMVRADLLREMAHGQDVSDTFSITDAQLDAMLTARGITPVWLLDGQAAGAQSGISFAAQGFGAQGAGTALLDWPHTVQWFLYAEGTFQRLDGGRLDLGVVRDSILDGTNDYQTFVESFEGIALRGFESLEIISTLRPNGLSAGTVSTTTY